MTLKALPRERIAPVVHPATKEALVLLRDITSREFGPIIDDAVATMAATIPGLPHTIAENLKKKAARLGLAVERGEIELPPALTPKPKSALKQPAIGEDRRTRKLTQK